MPKKAHTTGATRTITTTTPTVTENTIKETFSTVASLDFDVNNSDETSLDQVSEAPKGNSADPVENNSERDPGNSSSEVSDASVGTFPKKKDEAGFVVPETSGEQPNEEEGSSKATGPTAESGAVEIGSDGATIIDIVHVPLEESDGVADIPAGNEDKVEDTPSDGGVIVAETPLVDGRLVEKDSNIPMPFAGHTDMPVLTTKGGPTTTLNNVIGGGGGGGDGGSEGEDDDGKSVSEGGGRGGGRGGGGGGNETVPITDPPKKPTTTQLPVIPTKPYKPGKPLPVKPSPTASDSNVTNVTNGTSLPDAETTVTTNSTATTTTTTTATNSSVITVSTSDPLVNLTTISTMDDVTNLTGIPETSTNPPTTTTTETTTLTPSLPPTTTTTTTTTTIPSRGSGSIHRPQVLPQVYVEISLKISESDFFCGHEDLKFVAAVAKQVKAPEEMVHLIPHSGKTDFCQGLGGSEGGGEGENGGGGNAEKTLTFSYYVARREKKRDILLVDEDKTAKSQEILENLKKSMTNGGGNGVGNGGIDGFGGSSGGAESQRLGAQIIKVVLKRSTSHTASSTPPQIFVGGESYRSATKFGDIGVVIAVVVAVLAVLVFIGVIILQVLMRASCVSGKSKTTTMMATMTTTSCSGEGGCGGGGEKGGVVNEAFECVSLSSVGGSTSRAASRTSSFRRTKLFRMSKISMALFNQTSDLLEDMFSRPVTYSELLRRAENERILEKVNLKGFGGFCLIHSVPLYVLDTVFHIQ